MFLLFFSKKKDSKTPIALVAFQGIKCYILCKYKKVISRRFICIFYTVFGSGYAVQQV